jgi:hypothetical protein
MKCEVLDLVPEWDMKFRVATVVEVDGIFSFQHLISFYIKVLRGGEWLRVKCDDYDDLDDLMSGMPIETYPIHIRSPYLLPLGTAKEYGLPLKLPIVNGLL